MLVDLLKWLAVKLEVEQIFLSVRRKGHVQTWHYVGPELVRQPKRAINRVTTTSAN